MGPPGADQGAAVSRGGHRFGAGRKKGSGGKKPGAKAKSPGGNARPDNLVTPSELVIRRGFRKQMGEWAAENLYQEFLGVLDQAKHDNDWRLVYQTLSEIGKITVGVPVPMAEVTAADTFAEMIRRMAGVNEAGEPLPPSSLSPAAPRGLLPPASTHPETDRVSNGQSGDEIVYEGTSHPSVSPLEESLGGGVGDPLGVRAAVLKSWRRSEIVDTPSRPAADPGIELDHVALESNYHVPDPEAVHVLNIEVPADASEGQRRQLERDVAAWTEDRQPVRLVERGGDGVLRDVTKG